MMEASDKGHQSIVQLLFKSRARVNETNEVSDRTSTNVYWKSGNFINYFKLDALIYKIMKTSFIVNLKFQYYCSCDIDSSWLNIALLEL